MARYAIVTDLNRCVGCQACSAACKTINGVMPGDFWIKTLRIGPTPKRAVPATGLMWRCTSSPSSASTAKTRVCEGVPDQASHVTEDGTVQIDKDKCIGCQFCAMACPYGVRYLNEEERVVEKCTLCQQRTAQGELPQCVAQCGSRARFFGDLDEGLESFQALAPTHDLETPYEEMMQNRTTLGEWVEPFTEADVYHLTDTGNGPKHCYILRNRKWQGEE